MRLKTSLLTLTLSGSVALMTPMASAQLSFVSAGNSATGQDPESSALADVDGDGDLDIIVANGDSNFLTLMLNNGGSFTASNIGISGQASGVVAADLDGDGDMDLATANGNTNSTSILLNNGAGGFAQTAVLPAGAKPRHLCAADFDGDLDVDLAVVNRDSNNVSLFSNSGAATFTASGTLAVGADPRFISAGDLDGDGDADLAVTNHDGNSVSLFTNVSGVFSASSSLLITRPNAVVMADVDGDGDRDLLVSVGHGGVNNVTVFTNSGGLFAQTGAFNTGLDPQEIAAFDADGDGDLDVATANAGSNNVSLLENTGVGTFLPAVTVAASTKASGCSAGDLDGDLSPDLVIANSDANNVTLLINQHQLSGFSTYGSGCAGSLGVPAFSGSGAVVGGGAVSLTLTNALQNSTALLFMGTQQVALALPGGCTLLAGGTLILPGLALPVDGTGSLTVGGNLPATLPSGALFFQMIVVDGGAANGQFAVSNGVKMTLP